MAQIGYQTAYLWECPDCGKRWQRRRRPRAGDDLVCAADGEQRGLVEGAWACASIHTSTGKREGIAPNVSL